MGRDAHFFLISAERGALIPEDDSGVSGALFACLKDLSINEFILRSAERPCGKDG